MEIIRKLPQILEESEKEFNNQLYSDEAIGYIVKEKVLADKGGVLKNQLVYADNIKYMQYLLRENDLEGKIKLIYIDPPFCSNTDYKIDIRRSSNKIEKIPLIEHFAYKDTWQQGLEGYLKMLCIRLFFMKELLSETGSIFLHLDWHVVHYVKVLMDAIFGEERFVNEIVWSYKSGGVSHKYFARKHDTILFYSKTKSYTFNVIKEKSYNRDLKPYRFKGVKEYKDENGWYTMVNMKDVWNIDMVGRTSGERVGYATQKPEMLLERILLACTNEGDICADFFCGAGTLGAAASKLNRSWLLCDSSKIACMMSHKRMIQKNVGYEYATMQDDDDATKTYIEFDKFEIADGNVQISLGRYGYIDEKNIPVHSKYLENIKEIIEKDSLKLIEYWSIDTAYDHKEFMPKWHFARTSDKLATEVFFKYAGKDDIAIRILDVFGNETFVVKGLGSQV
ncbi:MAG: site-specific DNA-methyltransferase [Clostridiales bacterium]|nr:site-specific DNA-methyltransferase [Clostridiales bacterium]